jgi:hypothetical protein
LAPVVAGRDAKTADAGGATGRTAGPRFGVDVWGFVTGMDGDAGGRTVSLTMASVSSTGAPAEEDVTDSLGASTVRAAAGALTSRDAKYPPPAAAPIQAMASAAKARRFETIPHFSLEF